MGRSVDPLRVKHYLRCRIDAKIEHVWKQEQGVAKCTYLLIPKCASEKEVLHFQSMHKMRGDISLVTIAKVLRSEAR